jgi:hypothetical protein
MKKDEIHKLFIKACKLLEKETGWMHYPSCPAFGAQGDKEACNCSAAKRFLKRKDVQSLRTKNK